MILETTSCAGSVLSYFDVKGVTWNERTQKNVWPETLRRNGFAVRSRASKIKSKTVGGARSELKAIAIEEPQIEAFVVRVNGHVLLLNTDGKTIVDTSPRRIDRRCLKGVLAVWRKAK